jgi:hypothetical protein
MSGLSGGDSDARERALVASLRSKLKPGAGGGFNVGQNNLITRSQPPPQMSNKRNSGQQPGGPYYATDDTAVAEDDMMSVVSRHTYSAAPLNMFTRAVVDEETMEQRRREWFDLRYEKSEAEVDTDRENEIVENIKQVQRIQDNMDFSQFFLKRATAACVPSFCTRLHHAYVHIELCGEDRPGTVLDWKPLEPQTTFGAYMDWAQGHNIPHCSTKAGNLQNTYLIQASLKHVRSTYPCAVAVLLGEAPPSLSNNSSSTKDRFKPYNNRKWQTDIGTTAALLHEDPTAFHVIIPPRYAGEESLVAYTSRYEINDPMAMDFPNLTADKEVIMARTQELKNNITKAAAVHLVRKDDAILRHIFLRGDYILPGDMPTLDANTQGGTYRVKPSVYAKAVDDLSAEIEAKYPVRNLEQFKIRMIPLADGPAGKDGLARTALEREWETQDRKGGVSINNTKGSASRDTNVDNYRKLYTISFTLELAIMFRNIAQQATDDQNPDEDAGGGLALE